MGGRSDPLETEKRKGCQCAAVNDKGTLRELFARGATRAARSASTAETVA